MILRIEDVKKKYNDFELNCSMNIEEGRIVGLVGANGAGKSTTFRIILGLTHCDSGNIEILDRPSNELTPRDKENIGVVLGGNGFSEYLNIKGIILILKNMYHNFHKEEFISNCKKYNLPFDKPLKEFSTGMKTRLNILVAVSHDARLLILDEPTAGLDVVARESILDMLREYMETDGRSIIISSHIASDLEGFCDELYMLHNGKVIFHQSMDILLEEYGVIKVSDEQYEKIDKQYILYRSRQSYGYQCLTNEKQYYLDNFKDIVIEKTGIDDILMIIERGEKI